MLRKLDSVGLEKVSLRSESTVIAGLLRIRSRPNAARPAIDAQSAIDAGLFHMLSS